MGDAILTNFIGLVYETLKMIHFSRKHYFLPFKLDFGSMTNPKKRTLMATLLVGIDSKRFTFVWDPYGKNNPTQELKKNAIFIDTKNHLGYYFSWIRFGIWTFFGIGTSFLLTNQRKKEIGEKI